jgi:hypothetical protein
MGFFVSQKPSFSYSAFNLLHVVSNRVGKDSIYFILLIVCLQRVVLFTLSEVGKRLKLGDRKSLYLTRIVDNSFLKTKNQYLVHSFEAPRIEPIVSFHLYKYINKLQWIMWWNEAMKPSGLILSFFNCFILLTFLNSFFNGVLEEHSKKYD